MSREEVRLIVGKDVVSPQDPPFNTAIGKGGLVNTGGCHSHRLCSHSCDRGSKL